MTLSTLAYVDGPVSQQTPIDLVQLATNTLGNRDLEVQILHLFRSQSSTALERLDFEADVSLRRDLVHTLKGSARAIGAERVATICETLEQRMTTNVDASTDSLVAAVDEVNRYIVDLLQS